MQTCYDTVRSNDLLQLCDGLPLLFTAYRDFYQIRLCCCLICFYTLENKVTQQQQYYLFKHTGRASEIIDQYNGEAYFFCGPVLGNLDVWENSGHHFFRDILRTKGNSSWSERKCMCLDICLYVSDLPFLSKGCYESLQRAGQCLQWKWSAWWRKIWQA